MKVVAARDAQRRRGARFHAGQHRVGHVKALDLLAKGRQGFAHRRNRIARQRTGQVGEVHTRLVRRLHAAQRGGRTGSQKVTDQLARRFVSTAAQRVGLGLKLALKSNARQRMHRLAGNRAFYKISRCNAHHDAGIGIALVARILAHAVGHHAADFRGGGHHRAARAHAKTVDAAAIGSVVHQLVVGRAQQRMAGMLAQPCAVDQALRMLDAKADRKRLGFHENAALVQHGKGVARAVARCQHHVVGAKLVAAAVGQVVHCQATDVLAICVALNRHVAHALLKADLAAHGLDLLAHVLDHLDQLEGADMRFADQQNLFRRTGLDELQHHLAAQVARVLDLAPELAV